MWLRSAQGPWLSRAAQANKGGGVSGASAPLVSSSWTISFNQENGEH